MRLRLVGMWLAPSRLTNIFMESGGPSNASNCRPRNNESHHEISPRCLFPDGRVGPGLLPACQQNSGKPKVAFVTNNPESFWTIAEAGATKSAEKENVQLMFMRPDKGDPAVQRTVIDGAVDQGAKAVAVSVIDPKNQADYIDKIAAKIPFLCVDNDAPQTKRLCYIGTDNYEGGKAVGRLVKEALPDGGKIAIFVGDLAPSTPASGSGRHRRVGRLEDRKNRGRRSLRQIQTLPHLYRSAGRRPESQAKRRRRSRKRGIARRAERLSDRFMGVQSAENPQRGRRIKRNSARSKSSASTKTRRRFRASPTATSSAPSCRTLTNSASNQSK